MPKHTLTEDQREEACRRYLEGETGPALATRFGVGYSNVYRLLRARGIKRRAKGTLYACNQGFFNSIDSEDKAYWLGFIAADGCITDGERSRLNFLLAAKDRSHLEQFRLAIGSQKPIYNSTTEAFNGSFRVVGFQISSGGLIEGLEKHGITPRKSFTHKWPDFLDDDLLCHYLRGYFDGDGGFTKPINNPYHYAAFVLGSRPFLEGAMAFIGRLAGLPPVAIRERRKGGIHIFQYGGRGRVQTFARFLYRDATIYLPRKREKIAHLL